MPKPNPPGGRTDLLNLGRPEGGCGCGGQCGCGDVGQQAEQALDKDSEEADEW